MNYAWYDILGTLGVAVIIVTYVLLQAEKLRSDSLYYSLLNAAGASLIIVSLYFDFNFPAIIVEFFWLLISLLVSENIFLENDYEHNSQTGTEKTSFLHK